MDLKNVVVHCPTKELAKKVLKKADSLGYKWISGESFLDEMCWERYKVNTCYRIERGEFCYLDWYAERCYKIISAEDFLNEEDIGESENFLYAINEAHLPTKEETITIEGKKFTMSAIKKALNL